MARRHRAAARLGGGKKRIDAQHAKGKLSARERLELLVRATRAGSYQWDRGAPAVTYSARMKELLGYAADTDTALLNATRPHLQALRDATDESAILMRRAGDSVVCIDRAESMRAITVDGTVFHNLGASDAQELGASIAAGLEYVRSMTENGVAVSDALRQIEFRFAATDDQFQTIAKFRAARILWARIAQVCARRR